MMLISVMMLMITVTTMKMPSLISMKIGEGFAAEYSHTDGEDGDDDDDANIIYLFIYLFTRKVRMKSYKSELCSHYQESSDRL